MKDSRTINDKTNEGMGGNHDTTEDSITMSQPKSPKPFGNRIHFVRERQLLGRG